MKVDILGVKIDHITLAACIERIARTIEDNERLRVVTANPEMIFRASHDVRLRQVINTAGLVTADGIGVIWAAARLGTPLPERVTGIDLLEGLLPLARERKWRVFFLGGQPGVAELAAHKATGVNGFEWQAHHGYFTPAEEGMLLERIQAFRPQLLLAGLGSPRQEFWLAEHSRLAQVSIGVGGSFDALAGVVKRAPQWVQNLNLEWLYRLIREPKRFKRQLALPRFVLKVLAQSTRSQESVDRSQE
ncbi:WecB/TagA/CpsF family glycosyltransferase [Paradesulfitobacterium ferrireducens]|uniref:WecB/TagA/CpsF family glycosyltransferase n=1 Tax=Paradesulfitobacterium ferrireducens TaxID=2816476 RepID=UPI001A8E072D|nr:WecB/TagA/CpsF family glycosyltransferase [Paradesulfitobacterium ferrireducens]